MIITKTPLRISFAGGGTDLPGYYQNGYGAVVSMAISKHIYVTVHRRFDRSVRVSHANTEVVDHADELQHGIARECLKMVGIDHGIEITTIGEVPAGTGLGSSSALTVGLLNALYSYVGIQLSTAELLDQACKIEINALHAPVGKQDQSAAAYGGINYFRFNQDETVERERIWLSNPAIRHLEHNLMLFYTGIQRDANVILKKEQEAMAENIHVLDEMRDLADEMREVLKSNYVDGRFGELLHKGWERKCSLCEGITNPKIDQLYQRARKAGATGGKLVGAGGGGFLLFYCEEGRQRAVRRALGLRQMYTHVSAYGSRVVYFNG